MTPLPASRSGDAARAGAHLPRPVLVLAAVTTVAATAFFWLSNRPVRVDMSRGVPATVEQAATRWAGAADPARDTADVRLSASPPAAASMATDRYRLVGVMASGAAGPGDSKGLALIAVGGGPARAFQVGDIVEGETVLLDVSALGATLGPRDRSAPMSLRVAPAPAPAAEAMAPPAAGSIPTSEDRVDPISLEEEENIRVFGTRHPPLQQLTETPPQEPDDGAPEPDDGRWTPSGGQ